MDNETSEFLIEKDDGWYFTGSLTHAQVLAWEDRYSEVGRRDNLSPGNPWVWHVSLNDNPVTDSDDTSQLAEFGTGRTLEEAWRYALGAYFGPADADYFETGGDQRLGEALDAGRWPTAAEVSTGNDPLVTDQIVLVAFNVRAAGQIEAQHALLPHLKPVLASEGGPATEWWVANDDRIDGSDNDSAVFVRPGEQAVASRVLVDLGFTGENNLMPGGDTFGPADPITWSMLVIGNPADGFKHYGPMPKEAAISAGENIRSNSWWVMDLETPEGLS